MFEVQTKFTYGWENVWHDNDGFMTFDTKAEAQEEIDLHIEFSKWNKMDVNRGDFKIIDLEG